MNCSVGYCFQRCSALPGEYIAYEIKGSPLWVSTGSVFQELDAVLRRFKGIQRTYIHFIHWLKRNGINPRSLHSCFDSY